MVSVLPKHTHVTAGGETAEEHMDADGGIIGGSSAASLARSVGASPVCLSLILQVGFPHD